MGPQIARALRMRFKKLFAAVFAWINLAGAATRPSNNRALGA